VVNSNRTEIEDGVLWKRLYRKQSYPLSHRGSRFESGNVALWGAIKDTFTSGIQASQWRNAWGRVPKLAGRQIHLLCSALSRAPDTSLLQGDPEGKCGVHIEELIDFQIDMFLRNIRRIDAGYSLQQVVERSARYPLQFVC
jgi:hypothetical protein